MRRFLLPITATILLGALALLAWRGWYHFVDPPVAEAPQLDAGEQEVAWIHPATSGDSWERLVSALRRLRDDWAKVYPDLPVLQVSLEDAFLQQSAAMPQIALSFQGHENAKLWIRWYKLSGETDHRAWLEKLRRRPQPPLAIIGGDTSDRALALARSLQEVRQSWPISAPLFFITTASADRYYPGDIQTDASLTQETWPKLMQVYKDRTFRFCFTNTRMAEAVLDFVQDHPHIWPEYRCDPTVLSAAILQGEPLLTLGVLAAAGHARSPFLYTLAWGDDRYSQDLADRFTKVFVDAFFQSNGTAAGSHFINYNIPYSVGDFYQPNPGEQQAVGIYLADQDLLFRGQHQLLALPTGSQRARRFLRTLCRQAPHDVGNVIAITGDAITLNNVYRDRQTAWNVLDMPVPLIFFSHRNPIDTAAGFDRPRKKSGRINTTGTQDLLLMRDIVEALVQAAWTDDGWLGDSSQVWQNLAQTRWYQGRVGNPRLFPPAEKGVPLFDEEGNRRSRRGEHVVWLQPSWERGRVLPRATISVWSLDPQTVQTKWERVGAPLTVDYNQASPEGTPAHDGSQP